MQLTVLRTTLEHMNSALSRHSSNVTFIQAYDLSFHLVPKKMTTEFIPLKNHRQTSWVMYMYKNHCLDLCKA